MQSWMELANAVLESCHEDASPHDTRSTEAIMAQSSLINTILKKQERQRTGRTVREQIKQQLAEEAECIQRLSRTPVPDCKDKITIASPTATSVSSSSDIQDSPDMRRVVVVGFQDSMSVSPQKMRPPRIIGRTSAKWSSPIGIP